MTLLTASVPLVLLALVLLAGFAGCALQHAARRSPPPIARLVFSPRLFSGLSIERVDFGITHVPSGASTSVTETVSVFPTGVVRLPAGSTLSALAEVREVVPDPPGGSRGDRRYDLTLFFHDSEPAGWTVSCTVIQAGAVVATAAAVAVPTDTTTLPVVFRLSPPAPGTTRATLAPDTDMEGRPTLTVHMYHPAGTTPVVTFDIARLEGTASTTLLHAAVPSNAIPMTMTIAPGAFTLAEAEVGALYVGLALAPAPPTPAGTQDWNVTCSIPDPANPGGEIFGLTPVLHVNSAGTPSFYLIDFTWDGAGRIATATSP